MQEKVVIVTEIHHGRVGIVMCTVYINGITLQIKRVPIHNDELPQTEYKEVLIYSRYCQS